MGAAFRAGYLGAVRMEVHELLVFQLLSRRNALHERAMYRRAQLADSFHLQQFFRDSDELKSWVNEKMKTATDEAYKVRHC